MKLITSEVIIDLVKRRFKPIDSDWESDALDIIAEGIESVKDKGGRLGHELTWKALTVKDNRTTVPQDAESLEFVVYEGDFLRKAKQRDAVNPVETTVSDRTNADAITELENLTQRYEGLQTMIDNETNLETLLILTAKQEEITQEILTLSTQLVDKPVTAALGTEYYFEQGHAITTSFTEGEILVYYMKYFTDKLGYPYIVDTHAYRQALYYYFVVELMSQGYEHKAYKLDNAMDAHDLWAQRAANGMNTWGVEEHEQYARASVRMKRNYNLGASNFKGV